MTLSEREKYPGVVPSNAAMSPEQQTSIERKLVSLFYAHDKHGRDTALFNLAAHIHDLGLGVLSHQ